MLTRFVRWNLRGHRRRNFVTVLSVAIAIGLASFFLAVRLTMQRAHEATGYWHRLAVVSRYPGTNPMTRASHAEVAKAPGVTEVIDLEIVEGTSGDKTYQFEVIGTDDGWAEAAGPRWFGVTSDEIEQWKHERTGALVGDKAGAALGLKKGEPAILTTDSGELKVKVVGITTGGFEPDLIDVHYDYLDDFLGKPGKVQMRTVDTATDEQLAPAATAIEALFRNSASPARAIPFSYYLDMAQRRVNAIPNLLSTVGLIVLFTTLLVTANTISISVRERLQQIATLRAIGYRRGAVFLMTVGEALAICLLGGVIGAVLPRLIFPGGVGLGERFFAEVHFENGIIAQGIGLSALLGIVASAVPAVRASRIVVVEALRGVA